MKKSILSLVILVLMFVPVVTFAQLDVEESAIEDLEVLVNQMEDLESETINDVVVSADQVINHNYFKFGQNVTLNGVFEKDVYIFGNNLIVNGEIKGDLFFLGNTLLLTGNVHGNVRGAANQVEVSSQIGKNLMLAGTEVILSKGSQVGWDLIAGTWNLNVDSLINGDVYLSSVEAVFNNKVNGTINLRLGEGGSFYLGEQSEVLGDLNYSSYEVLDLDVSKIKGNVSDKLLTANISDFANSFANKVYSLLGLILIGLIMVGLAGFIVKDSKEILKKNLAKTIGWGALGCLVTPFVAVLLMFTGVGLSLALILLGIWLVLIYISTILVGAALGSFVFGKLRKKLSKTSETSKNKKGQVILEMVLGVVILYLIYLIPMVGPLVGWLVILLGFGLVINLKKKYLNKLNK